MKLKNSKEVILLFVVATLLFSFSVNALSECTAGYCPTNMSIRVIGITPYNATDINVYSPNQGAIYYVDANKSVLFNITASDLDGISSLWYSLNGGENITFSGSSLVYHSTIGMYITTFCAKDNLNNVTCKSVSYDVESAGGGGGGGGGGSKNINASVVNPFIQQVAFTGGLSNISNMVVKFNEWRYGVQNVITIEFFDRNGSHIDVPQQDVQVNIMNKNFAYDQLDVIRLSEGVYIKTLSASQQNATSLIALVTYDDGVARFSKTIDLINPNASSVDIWASQLKVQMQGWFGDNWLMILVGVAMFLVIGLVILILNTLGKGWWWMFFGKKRRKQ